MRYIDRPMTTADGLRAGLKAKSRARREDLKLAAQGEPVHPTPRNDILPLLQLVDRSPADLRIPARNVRASSEVHIREVANSISTLGFCDPVLIDQHNGVLDGAVRVEAARLLRLPAIPCIIAGHLTASERKLLRVALNRLQERGAWDLQALRLEIGELILEDAPIEIAGFTGGELDQILLGDEGAVEQGPLEPEPNQHAVARRGDVFLLGEHVIACGDATDPAYLARVMEGEEARLILTDVPYNVRIAGNVTRRAHREFAMASGEMTDAEFLAFNRAWISACARHSSTGGAIRRCMPPRWRRVWRRSISSSGPRRTPAWAACIDHSTNCSPCTKAAALLTSIMCCWAGAGAGDQTCGPIPAPPVSGPMHARA
jgi:hypothetical protein